MNNGFFEQVKSFVAIARTGSLSAAGTQLGLLQPTISRQLAALEERLGCQLVRRSTRALTLTEQGEQFLEHATRLLQVADDAQSSLSTTGSDFKGRLRVSCSNAFARHILVPGLPLWQRHNPDVHVEVFPSDEIEPLVAKNFDLAIRVGVLPDSSLVARRIGQFNRHVVASRKYVERSAKLAEPGQLKHHQCIVLAGAGRQRPWTFKSADGNVSVSVSGRLSVATVDAFRAAVLADLGIAVTPTWFWKDELATGVVVRLLEDFQVPRQQVYAVSNVRHARHTKEAAFIDFVEQAFAPHSVGS